MVATASNVRKAAALAALGSMLLLAGCQSGNPLGALDLGGGGQARQPAPAPDGRITVEELLAYCPSVTMRSQNAVYDSFQRGGEGDPSKLAYRASISEVTRACSYGGGAIGMTIAAAGRVVPGQAGAPGAVRLPIRVTVYRDTELVHDQVVEHQVMLADIAGATQFVFSDQSVSIPNVTSRNIRVFLGFGDKAPAGRR